jgi:heme exporter protein C
VSFLIVFLLFACYQPLRFSIDDPERQARYAAVFAIIGGAFVPLNFLAVRLASALVHPRVLSTTGGAMPGSMRLTFLISFLAMVCLFVTLWKYELASKHASMRLRRLRRALAGDEAAGPLARTAAPTPLRCRSSPSTTPGRTSRPPPSCSSH